MGQPARSSHSPTIFHWATRLHIVLRPGQAARLHSRFLSPASWRYIDSPRQTAAAPHPHSTFRHWTAGALSGEAFYVFFYYGGGFKGKKREKIVAARMASEAMSLGDAGAMTSIVTVAWMRSTGCDELFFVVFLCCFFLYYNIINSCLEVWVMI